MRPIMWGEKRVKKDFRYILQCNKEIRGVVQPFLETHNVGDIIKTKDLKEMLEPYFNVMYKNCYGTIYEIVIHKKEEELSTNVCYLFRCRFATKNKSKMEITQIINNYSTFLFSVPDKLIEEERARFQPKQDNLKLL